MSDQFRTGKWSKKITFNLRQSRGVIEKIKKFNFYLSILLYFLIVENW